MSFRSLHDHVLFRRVKAQEKAPAEFLFPTTRRKNRGRARSSLRAASRAPSMAVSLRSTSRAGDRVLFGKWSSTEVKLGGEDLIIMKESGLLGILG